MTEIPTAKLQVMAKACFHDIHQHEIRSDTWATFENSTRLAWMHAVRAALVAGEEFDKVQQRSSNGGRS